MNYWLAVSAKPRYFPPSCVLHAPSGSGQKGVLKRKPDSGGCVFLSMNTPHQCGGMTKGSGGGRCEAGAGVGGGESDGEVDRRSERTFWPQIGGAV